VDPMISRRAGVALNRKSRQRSARIIGYRSTGWQICYSSAACHKRRGRPAIAIMGNWHRTKDEGTSIKIQW